jgi:HlyD family secretion protein
MTANASILTAYRDHALKIPNAALRFRPEAAKREAVDQKKSAAAGYKIWVPGQQKRPVPVEITTGISDGAFTEVVSENLKEGQEVIVEGIGNGAKSGANSPRSSLPSFPGPR